MLLEMFWRSLPALKKKATANCDSPEINTAVESNKPWLDDTPEPVKILILADVADVSGGECNALVLKDWEEFTVCVGTAGCVGNADTS